MTVRHIRHLPTMQAEQLIGTISISDLVKSLIAEKKRLSKAWNIPS